MSLQVLKSPMRLDGPDRILSRDERESWAEILRSAGLTSEANLVKNCDLESHVYVCGDFGKDHFEGVRYRHCNLREYCPACAYRYAGRKAFETYRFLEENIVKRVPFAVYAFHITLTTPHYIKLTDRELKTLAEKLLSKEGGELTFNIESVQQKSSNDPFSDHKHIHIFSLNVGLVRDKDFGSYRVVRYRPWFNVDLLRKNWKSLLESKANCTIPTDVDLKVRYTPFSNRSLVHHWLRYMYRYPVWDVFKYLVRTKSICRPEEGYRGENPPVYVQELTMTLGQGRKVTWSGFLSNTKRYSKLKSFRVYSRESERDVLRLAELQKRIREASKLCPVCGARLVEFIPTAPPPRTENGAERDIELRDFEHDLVQDIP